MKDCLNLNLTFKELHDPESKVYPSRFETLQFSRYNPSGFNILVETQGFLSSAVFMRILFYKFEPNKPNVVMSFERVLSPINGYISDTKSKTLSGRNIIDEEDIMFIPFSKITESGIYGASIYLKPLLSTDDIENIPMEAVTLHNEQRVEFIREQ